MDRPYHWEQIALVCADNLISGQWTQERWYMDFTALVSDIIQDRSLGQFIKYTKYKYYVHEFCMNLISLIYVNVIMLKYV